MTTPQRTFPADSFLNLFNAFRDDIDRGFFVAEILQHDSNTPAVFVGRLANPSFCKLLSVNENVLLGMELPEAFCRILDLPGLLCELRLDGTTHIRRDLSLSPERQLILQAHLPSPELLIITIQNTSPGLAMISSQAEMILASLGDPCCIVDRNFSVLYENETAKQLWGSNQGKRCHASYHGRQSPCEPCHSADVFTDGKIHKEAKLAYFNGREHHLEITSAPLKDGAGHVFAVVNITHDVTLRKMTEKSKELHQGVTSLPGQNETALRSAPHLLLLQKNQGRQRDLATAGKLSPQSRRGGIQPRHLPGMRGKASSPDISPKISDQARHKYTPFYSFCILQFPEGHGKCYKIM